jgi:hypothetical protein
MITRKVQLRKSLNKKLEIQSNTIDLADSVNMKNANEEPPTGNVNKSNFEDLSTIEHSIHESFIKNMASLFEKPVRNKTEEQKAQEKKILDKQTSMKELKTLRLWITPQNSGALVFRLSEQLNFIKKPFSINFIYGAFGSIRFDLFGIQKDRLLEQNSHTRIL